MDNSPTPALMKEINAAFNSRDVDRILAFFADDCTFLMARGPEADGRRVRGKEAVRRVLADRFKVIPDMRWDHVDGFICGNRAVSVWMVTGQGKNGERLNYRGCDIYEFRGDKILQQGHLLEARRAGRSALVRRRTRDLPSVLSPRCIPLRRHHLQPPGLRPARGGQDIMKTLIEGGWVVAWNGAGHEVYEEGAVVFENDRIVHAGGPYAGAVDTRLSARGKLVSPGFINTHVHTAGNAGDYLLLDMAKNDYRTANYMSFAAPLKGKVTPPPPAAMAALRAFVFLHTLKQGTTTIIDVGGLRGDWEGYARLVDDLGVRVYGSLAFRDRNTFMDAQGRLVYDEDTAAGTQGLQEAVDAGQALRRRRAGDACAAS